MAQCVQCKDKKSNRPGGLCATCHAAKFKGDDGPDGTDETVLMKWIIDGAPCKRPIQAAYKADFNKNPRAFLARYKELTGIGQATLPNGNIIAVGDWGQTEGWPTPDWSKFPKCPCCKRPAPIPDPTSQKLLAMVKEREAKWQEEWRKTMLGWTDEELKRRNLELQGVAS